MATPKRKIAPLSAKDKARLEKIRSAAAPTAREKALVNKLTGRRRPLPTVNPRDRKAADDAMNKYERTHLPRAAGTGLDGAPVPKRDRLDLKARQLQTGKINPPQSRRYKNMEKITGDGVIRTRKPPIYTGKKPTPG